MQSHLEEKAAFLQTKGGLNLQPHVVVIVTTWKNYIG